MVLTARESVRESLRSVVRNGIERFYLGFPYGSDEHSVGALAEALSLQVPPKPAPSVKFERRTGAPESLGKPRLGPEFELVLRAHSGGRSYEHCVTVMAVQAKTKTDIPGHVIVDAGGPLTRLGDTASTGHAVILVMSRLGLHVVPAVVPWVWQSTFRNLLNNYRYIDFEKYLVDYFLPGLVGGRYSRGESPGDGPKDSLLISISA